MRAEPTEVGYICVCKTMGKTTWEVANVIHWLNCMTPFNVVQLLKLRVSDLRVVVKVLGV